MENKNHSGMPGRIGWVLCTPRDINTVTRARSCLVKICTWECGTHYVVLHTPVTCHTLINGWLSSARSLAVFIAIFIAITMEACLPLYSTIIAFVL